MPSKSRYANVLPDGISGSGPEAMWALKELERRHPQEYEDRANEIFLRLGDRADDRYARARVPQQARWALAGQYQAEFANLAEAKAREGGWLPGGTRDAAIAHAEGEVAAWEAKARELADENVTLRGLLAAVVFNAGGHLTVSRLEAAALRAGVLAVDVEAADYRFELTAVARGTE